MKKETENKDDFDFNINLGVFLPIILSSIFYSVIEKYRYSFIVAVLLGAILFITYNYFLLCEVNLNNTKFNILTRKYKIFKIWFTLFIIIFILQHSKLTQSSWGYFTIESKHNDGSYFKANEISIVNSEFVFESLLKNRINYIHEIDVKKYKTKSYKVGFYCEVYPNSVDKEILYLKATLTDMRTIILLGFLFDYDKMFE